MGTVFKLVSVMLLAATVGHAQTIEIGDVHSAGTGCPAGTVAVHENPNGPERLLLLSNFKAQASSSMRLDRKTCSIAIPIKVPAGYSVALEGIVVGSQRTARGARTALSQEFFIAGSIGQKLTKNFTPGSSTRFRQPSPALQWTPCGSDSILRANLSLLTQVSARAQVEAVLLSVQYRRCR